MTTQYVKLTNESGIHHGFQYKEGLNVDILEFNPVKECVPGGLYFCRYEDITDWINYNGEYMIYMWDVKIPEGETIVDMGNKLKAHKIILSNKRNIWEDKDLCLEVVKQDGYALEFVKERTQEICMEAVKQDGYALRFVKEQTPELCLEAVKQNGYALEFVKEQTPEICLKAVKQNRYAFKYVKEQTPEICMEAVKQYGYTLQFVKEQTPEICLEAVKQYGLFLEFVKEQNPEICLEAVKQDEDAQKYVKI